MEAFPSQADLLTVLNKYMARKPDKFLRNTKKLLLLLLKYHAGSTHFLDPATQLPNQRPHEKSVAKKAAVCAFFRADALMSYEDMDYFRQMDLIDFDALEFVHSSLTEIPELKRMLGTCSSLSLSLSPPLRFSLCLLS